MLERREMLISLILLLAAVLLGWFSPAAVQGRCIAYEKQMLDDLTSSVSCNGPSDCTFIGGPRSPCNYVPISKSGLAAAQEAFRKFRAACDPADLAGVCTLYPPPEPTCLAGRCVVPLNV
jgi:hypothetical protein